MYLSIYIDLIWNYAVCFVRIDIERINETIDKHIQILKYKILK